jgi:hypothetical protein
VEGQDGQVLHPGRAGGIGRDQGDAQEADGKLIKVPVDRLSDEDRQFLESQEKSAFSDSPAPKDTAKSAPAGNATGLRYGWKAGKSYTYQVKIEVEAGDDVLEFTGNPVYTVVSADKDKTVLGFRGTLMEFERSKSGRPPRPPGMGPGMMPGMMPGMRPGGMGPPIPRMPTPFSPMTGVGPMGMIRTSELTVDPLGNIARQEGTSQLPFLLGNLSHLMIEPLPETPESSWTLAHGSGVVIKEGGPPRFGPFANDEGFVPATVKTVYTIESQTVSAQQYHLTPGGEGRGEATGINGRPDDGGRRGTACDRPCRAAPRPGTRELPPGGFPSRHRAISGRSPCNLPATGPARL